MRLLLLTATAAALAACSPDAGARQQPGPEETRIDEAAPEMASPGVQRVEADGQAGSFTDAWIRTPPAGRDIAAGYVTIETREADALVRADTVAADGVELHTMSMDGNVMRMRRIDRIETSAEPVALRPGGDHLMIFGLSEEARLSGTVTVNLYFESGFTAPVEFQVSDRMPGMDGPPGQSEPGEHR
ncbi:copper chaperone PCu(A)C [Marinicauda algicola]|uniref:Copper chaperone PCu(A)C n=1 Tax=Marinicauda algicola TaxID=2029849 RepID=A0A4V3RY37_9PROT|nr:copper chaperone PCu(A)C [Marinicauda algicola]TGY88889.1 copper chaperone PCu(A)C [Marinicauda algicola]